MGGDHVSESRVIKARNCPRPEARLPGSGSPSPAALLSRDAGLGEGDRPAGFPTHLSAFYPPGVGVKKPIVSMPGQFQWSPELVVEEAARRPIGRAGGRPLRDPGLSKTAAAVAISIRRTRSHTPSGRSRGAARARGDLRHVLLRVHGARSLRSRQPSGRAGLQGRSSPKDICSTTLRWNCWAGRRSCMRWPAPTSSRHRG